MTNKDMKILIEIKERKVKLVLLKGRKAVDEFCFEQEHQLSEKLLPEIDKLIRKNQLTPADIQKIETKADIKDSFTTYRIAKTVAKAFNWANAQKF